MTPISEGGVMTAWTPPSLSYYRQSDGTVLILDETGNPCPTPPDMQFPKDKDGSQLVLDPWGNEIPAYRFPEEFFIHTAADGTLTAVDAAGVPLPTQPELHHGMDDGDPAFTMLPPKPVKQELPDNVYVYTDPDGTQVATDGLFGGPLDPQPDFDYWYDSHGPPWVPGSEDPSDPVKYEPPTYEFPEEFFIHTAADGTLTAVDAAGVPLSTQPEMHHGLDDGDPAFAVLPSGWTKDEPPAYELPDGARVEPDSEGNLTVIGESGELLSVQPRSEDLYDLLHPDEVGEETDSAASPGPIKYEPPVYEFPEEFFIHTAVDGSMTAVDATGVPLPVQPTMGHEHDAPDYAVLSDGTKYVAPTYEFPEEFFIHTAVDGSMTAVDATGVPLPTQPEMHHGMDDGDLDFAVLPDGTKYEADSLYPPPGEPPEEWPPEEPAASEDAGEDVADESPVAPQEETGGEPPSTADDAAKSYTGVHMSEEDVLLDEDWSGDEPATEVVTVRASEDLLTAGLVDTGPGGEVSVIPINVPDGSMPVGDEVVSAIPITLPDEPTPVGDEVVSAIPITLPGEEMPVGDGVVSGPGGEVSVIPINIPDGSMPVGDEVVSATPIPLPDEPPVLGDEVVSVLPVPVPEPPIPVEAAGDQVALDRKGGDSQVEIKLPDTPDEPAAEFHVEVIDEIQVEEVRLEDVETGNIELAEPVVERGDVSIEEEAVDDLDG
ncbi:MAG: hypothetical protein U9R51_06525 [Actinomycetota bacterium]|nr:hypothetical protein [Actinomycetota bacterium]